MCFIQNRFFIRIELNFKNLSFATFPMEMAQDESSLREFGVGNFFGFAFKTLGQ